jgi:hypothetical protein
MRDGCTVAAPGHIAAIGGVLRASTGEQLAELA